MGFSGNSLNEAAVQIKDSCIARDLSLDHTGPWGRGVEGNKVHYALEQRLPAPPPKEVACKVGVKRGGERRGKGGEIGERRREKTFLLLPPLFCVCHAG